MNQQSLKEFESAVSYSFELAYVPVGDDSKQSLKSQADEYLNRVKQDPKGIEYTLELLNFTSSAQVEFWCFQTFASLLLRHQAIANGDTSVQAMTDEMRFVLRRGVLTWVEMAVRESQGEPTSPINSAASTSVYLSKPYFVQQKVSVVVALLIKFDLLDQWPDACSDLIQLLNRGPGAIALFLSVLSNLDQEVVMPSISRGKGDLRHSSLVKDRLRVAGIPVIIEACYTIMLAYREVDATFVRQALHVCSTYISWIELSLIYNDRFIPLFFHFLEDKRYRCPAMTCIQCILHKGVTPVSRKLEMVGQMGVIDVVHGIARKAIETENVDEKNSSKSISPSSNQVNGGNQSSLASDDDDDDTDLVSFMESVSDLSNLIAMELLQCVDSNSILIQGVSEALQSLWQIILLCFAFHDIDVQQGVRESISAIVSVAKSGHVNSKAKSSTNGPSSSSNGTNETNFMPWVFDALPRLLELVMNNMAYPPQFKFRTDDEDDAEFEVHRIGLKTLYINMVRIAAAETVLPCLKTVVSAIFGPNATVPLASRPFNQVEVILNCVYAFAEGVPLIVSHAKAKNYKTTPNAHMGTEENRKIFAELVEMVLRTTRVDVYQHHAVALIHNEVFARYATTLVRFVPSVIGPELENMASIGGVHHSHPKVRSRSCYLLLKTSKALVNKIGSYAQAVLQVIQDVMVVAPSVCFENEMSDTPGVVSTQRGVTNQYSLDDICNMFELAGFLIAGQWLDDSNKVTYMKLVMGPLHQKIDESLNNVGNASQSSMDRLEFNGSIVGIAEYEELTSRWIGSCVAGLAALTKGFTSKADPGIAELFKHTLNTVVRALKTFPRQSFLRSQVMFYLHRMVSFLEEDFVGYTPEILQTLLAIATEPSHVVVIVEWAIQLNSKFMRLMYNTMESMFLHLVQAIGKFTSLMSDDWRSSEDNTPLTHDELERTNLIRSYTLFLMNLATSHMTDVLFAQPNQAQFSFILSTLASSMALCPEVNTQKACCDIIYVLVEKWGPETNITVVDNNKSSNNKKNSVNSRLAAGEVPLSSDMQQVFRNFVAEAVTPMSLQALHQPWVKPASDARSSLLVARVCKLHLLLYQRYGAEWSQVLQQTISKNFTRVQNVASQYLEGLATPDVTVTQLKNVLKPAIQN